MGLNLFSGQLSVDKADALSREREEKEHLTEGKRKPASTTHASSQFVCRPEKCKKKKVNGAYDVSGID